MQSIMVSGTIRENSVLKETRRGKPYVEFVVDSQKSYKKRDTGWVNKNTPFTVRAFGTEKYLRDIVLKQAFKDRHVTILGEIEIFYTSDEEGSILKQFALIPGHHGLDFAPFTDTGLES